MGRPQGNQCSIKCVYSLSWMLPILVSPWERLQASKMTEGERRPLSATIDGNLYQPGEQQAHAYCHWLAQEWALPKPSWVLFIRKGVGNPPLASVILGTEEEEEVRDRGFSGRSTLTRGSPFPANIPEVTWASRLPPEKPHKPERAAQVWCPCMVTSPNDLRSHCSGDLCREQVVRSRVRHTAAQVLAPLLPSWM